MSVLHMAYRANEKIVRRAKNIQRKRRDKKDIYALMVNDGRVEEEQKKRIRDFWKPYGKTDPIDRKSVV